MQLVDLSSPVFLMVFLQILGKFNHHIHCQWDTAEIQFDEMNVAVQNGMDN